MLSRLLAVLRFTAALLPLAIGFYVIADARVDVALTWHEWNWAQLALGTVPVAFAGWLVVSRPRRRRRRPA